MEFRKANTRSDSGVFQPDWVADGIRLEVKHRLKGLRLIRDILLRMGYAFSHEGFRGRAILLLIEPNISYERLLDEWKMLKSVFRPEWVAKLGIAVYTNNTIRGIPRDFDPELSAALLEVCEHETGGKRAPLPRPDYKAEIYKILIHAWLMKGGAKTSECLSQTAGCSYRTVANALESLGNALKRHSDKSVELEHFPKDAWQWLLANAEQSRLTKRYADHSGHPRSIESLLKRVAKIKNDHVALAGVLGARHYYPDLDLIGIPRLDLTLHCPGKYMESDFVEKLDPALREETDPQKPVSLVVHCIRRKKPLFKENPDGVPWADPVECLLDLHEMRLEPQASAFIDFMETQRGNR